MSDVEKLVLQFTAIDFASDPAFHDAVVSVIRAAGDCPHLEVLRLDSQAYPELLDKAVAECVQKSTVLEELPLPVERLMPLTQFLPTRVQLFWRHCPATIQSIELALAQLIRVNRLESTLGTLP